MDLNGEKAPNELGKDVVLINAESFNGVAEKYASETAGTASSKAFNGWFDF